MCNAGYSGKTQNIIVGAKRSSCITEADVSVDIFCVDIAQTFTQVSLYSAFRYAKFLRELPDTERFAHKEAADQYGETTG